MILTAGCCGASRKTAPHRILECSCASDAIRLIETETVDLVILDLVLPEMGGPAFCRWLKTNRKTQLVPVLMLTSVLGIENEIAGLTSGADEFLFETAASGSSAGADPRDAAE